MSGRRRTARRRADAPQEPAQEQEQEQNATVETISAEEAEAFRQWYKTRGTSRFLVRVKKENILDAGEAIWVDLGSYGEVLEAVKNAQGAQEETGGGALTSISAS